jgi:hypothetical protein
MYSTIKSYVNWLRLKLMLIKWAVIDFLRIERR